ncbi:hypothetical protein Lqui_0700 [Legionella quinlivanii]|uniref:WYL domain-containing protein n=1 Tax=Legionella quinlivanii TaxID=45073 RepID=A0A0W0Y550_9GAMM|nr:hypothetical protein [Legionella quinlivanii]KTD51856.1 hypothetical protein Lqui_0700 [Legionella quinlivanii]SEF83015.1 hypothetical protein SAMN02746093_01159 [Legionella quinlivanii DSM 21216]STY09683.1 Uncharacterised protein [Legionella quinlivanii]
MSSLETIITSAIMRQCHLLFSYDGHARRVEPHHYGILNGSKQLHAYQVSNGSKSGHLPEWRNFKLALMKDIRVDIDSLFEKRESYNPANARYSRIIKSIC